MKRWLLKVHKFDMCNTQRCVGPLVTSPLRSSSAPWTQGMQDMGLLWTCECAETKIKSFMNMEYDKLNKFCSNVKMTYNEYTIVYNLFNF